MRAEAQYSILQNKFRKWFDEPVPGDIPLLEEVDHSVENSFPVDRPLIVEGRHPKPKTRKRRREALKRHNIKSTYLIELLFFGFIGAVVLGAGVGVITYIMNINFGGWYSDYWPSQSAVILIAIVLGFNIGLVNGYYFSQQRA